ncbi:DMT family transporter [Tabrizicola sp.]|uniref:DMT family transporter n=1 Tax=Tabrizicola sp. TaxID=2005166 RepID=UPI002624DD73|nr:DMT family transporter [Tabrizicola sp.]MDM7932635.1 DMT family transporter [Tabrizicola sp.]
MQSEGRPLRGVALVVAATFLFAVADTLGKHLAMLYATSLILAARYGVNLLIVTAVMWPRHRAALWRTERTGLVILRGLCLAIASITMLLALRVMPVAETVAIIYITPVLVMLAAGTVLGERVSLWGWIGAGLGFVGVLLVARPGSGLDPWGVALALVNAVLATGYHLLTRVLARSETTMAMMFHTALVGTVVFSLLVVVLHSGEVPDLPDLGLMVSLGALATVAHLMFTSAYREAPASTLAPVNYMHIAFATVLGALVFRQLPDALGFLGMGAIAAAGILAAWQASRLRFGFSLSGWRK